ncbi:hypothetical protein COB72_08545 [bacterium]|nr:MAG: hypothetical protein COB72_08545 [bacterium]
MKRRRTTASLAAIAAIGTLIVTGASAANQDPSMREGLRPVVTEGAPVTPISGLNIPELFSAKVSQDRKHVLPHPPIDQIPWIPMPDTDGVGIRTDHTSGDRSVVSHNALTGATSKIDAHLPSNAIGGQSLEGDYPGFGNMIDTYDETLESFGNMSLAGSLDTWPRSGNVKIIMRFTDTSGTFRWFACSGSMQDSGVVLVAAHCVFNRAADISDWADIIYIYPAWDGVNNNGPFGAPDSGEVIQNFGYAFGTTFLAGSGYVNNGDWDADIGLIRITRGTSRNIGMLTGWYAWAWGGSCATIQSRTYNNFSYPSQNCPTAGMHNGRDMYFWSGSIDDCPGNQMELSTGGNCLDTVWGGMSGSGMYYIDGDNRYVHAICSTSNRTTWGRYCKFWESFTTSMVNYENATRGNIFDIEALQFRAGGSTSVFQGQALDAGATVSIANATNNNPAADSYTLRVYLSTNNNISSGDTLLATWTYNTDFAAMQTRTFNVPAPTIPLDTPPGTYWIGVEIDPSEDGISSNNDTDTWDAQQITVLEAHPDLNATQCDAVSGTYYRGQSVSVTHRTYNDGERISGNVHLEFRASTNDFITTFDTLMEVRNYSPLTVGDSHWFVSSVQIPADLNPGTYFIGTIVSESLGLETNTTNNWVSDIDTITVLECPADLNGDGVLNFFDVSAFLQAFNAMDPIADFNGDGVFNFFDVSAFLNTYAIGCP